MDGLLSKHFLSNIGVTLDEPTYQALSEHYEETLNDRIIDEITQNLDEAQLKELSHLRVADEQSLQQWLMTNVPQLDEIIEAEVAILMGDIAESADSI
jgi:hypothetical protein